MAKKSKIEDQTVWESRYDENHNLLWTITSDNHREEYFLYKGAEKEFVMKAPSPLPFFERIEHDN